MKLGGVRDAAKQPRDRFGPSHGSAVAAAAAIASSSAKRGGTHPERLLQVWHLPCELALALKVLQASAR